MNNNINFDWSAKISDKGSTATHYKQPKLVCHYKILSSKTHTNKLHVLVTQWVLTYQLVSVGGGKNGESLDILT
jgi:hypothetical protein